MDLSILKSRLFFGARDVAQAGGLSPASAHVFCSRCVKDGRFLRLKRDFYVLAGNWEHYSARQLSQIANRLQVPSYLSLTTALAYHEITSQVQQHWFESVSTRRSATIQAGATTFVYHKLQRSLYFGFTRRNDLFLADPEKAVLDAAYLASLARSGIDWDAIDWGKIDKDRFDHYLAAFPEHLRFRMKEKCRI